MSFKRIVGSTAADFLVWHFFEKALTKSLDVSWRFPNILLHQGWTSYNYLWGRTLDCAYLQHFYSKPKHINLGSNFCHNSITNKFVLEWNSLMCILISYSILIHPSNSQYLIDRVFQSDSQKQYSHCSRLLKDHLF